MVRRRPHPTPLVHLLQPCKATPASRGAGRSAALQPVSHAWAKRHRSASPTRSSASPTRKSTTRLTHVGEAPLDVRQALSLQPPFSLATKRTPASHQALAPVELASLSSNADPTSFCNVRANVPPLALRQRRELVIALASNRYLALLLAPCLNPIHLPPKLAFQQRLRTCLRCSRQQGHARGIDGRHRTQ